MALLIGLGTGVFVAAPARADGITMQETEQYIADKLANSATIDGSSINSVQVANCIINFNTETSYSFASISIPANSIESAFGLGLVVEIDAWDKEPLFSQSSNDRYLPSTFSVMEFSFSGLEQADNFAKAIEHYAKLCGSVDPNGGDPFSK
jgi:hypothetical protein